MVPGPAPSPSTIELWIGGDVHLGDAPRPDLLEGLRPLLDGASGVINLEGPLGDARARDGNAAVRDPSTIVLSSAPTGLAILSAVGVQAVGVANNHALDGGPAGAARTVAALREASLVPVGAASGPAPAILRFGARRVALTAHDLGSGVPAALGDELAAARAAADDVLVATFHVTGPPSYLPTGDLRRAAEIALAAGARVVAAHGTHALGPVERRGDAVIAWGLGNLLFACDCTDAVDGAILRISLADGAPGARILPIDAGLRGAPARPSHDVPLMLALLEAIGSSPLTRVDGGASF